MKTNYTKNIDTFLFRRCWGDLFLGLSDADAGKIIKALYRYTNGEETPPKDFGDRTLVSVYSMIIRQLNYSSRRFIEKRFTEKTEQCNDERELKK